MRRNISATLLVLLALSVLALTLETKPAEATDPSYIIIKKDGSVSPSDAPIQRNGDYYNQTGDIQNSEICIERNNMTLDGNTYSITGGSYIGIGVNATGVNHVMFTNLKVQYFQNGIAFINSSYCQLYHSDIETGLKSDSDSIAVNVTNSIHITLYNDTAKAYRHGIKLYGSSYSRVFNCTSNNNNAQFPDTDPDGWGIDLTTGSNFNDVFDNDIASNHDGIGIQTDNIFTCNNSITNNKIHDNGDNGEGIGVYSSTYNITIERNNFLNNRLQASVDHSYNDSWDGGCPSYTLGGNHWYDYTGQDSNQDGIGDTGYLINGMGINYTDQYPLMQYNYTYKYLTVQSTGNGTTDPVPDSYPIPYPGMNVTVTAFPDSGYNFSYWLIDNATYKADNPITIAMDSNHALKAYFSIPTGGQGCPYLSSWNGSSYVLDNNILPASETSNGTDVKDYYLLQQPLVASSNDEQASLYSLKISEFENEQDHIDQVNLMAVDHSQNTSIAVTPEGEIITYTNPATLLSCVDDNGTNRLSEVSSMDGNVSDPSTYYQGYSGNWLVLDFGTFNASNANLILRDDQKCTDTCIDVQLPDLNGDWQTVEVLHPRDYWSMEAVNMTAYIPTSGNFTVRLLWTATHRLDYVGLDTSSQAQITVNSASPLSAVHSTQGDVTTMLLYDDENCVQLVNGQQITLDFTLPNCPQDSVRDFIFYTDGYYYTISP